MPTIAELLARCNAPPAKTPAPKTAPMTPKAANGFTPWWPSDTPMCPTKAKLSVRGGQARQHPKWTQWFKRYGDVFGWLRAHPGKPIGRGLIGPGPSLWYYSYMSNTGRQFSACAKAGDSPTGRDVIVYDSFREWEAAQIGRTLFYLNDESPADSTQLQEAAA